MKHMEISLYPAAPIRHCGSGIFELARPKPNEAKALYALMEAGAAQKLRLRNPHQDPTAVLAAIFKGELEMIGDEVHARWTIDAVRLMEVFEALPEIQI